MKYTGQALCAFVGILCKAMKAVLCVLSEEARRISTLLNEHAEAGKPILSAVHYLCASLT